MTKQHAKLSASGSSRWIACPGSVKAEEGIEDKSSTFANEGSVAHELAEQALTLGRPVGDWLGKTFKKWPEIKVDQEMVDSVSIYCDFVRSIEGHRLIEQKVDFSDWVPEGFGTSDAIVIDDNTLHVIDLKYGKGVVVSPENNSQAMLYALGAYSFASGLCDINQIDITIVQPRLDHIETWCISVPELLKFGAMVQQKAEEALKDDAPRVPGESQCRWCKAKATCPALKKLTDDSVLSLFDDPLDSLGDDELGTALNNKKLIIGWLDAVEDLIKQRLTDGEGFPGYKLVAGRSSRSWINQDIAEKKLSDLLGEDAFITKLVTPPQAEKRLGKEKAKSISDLIVKGTGKPTLVPESDKRPSINITKEDFD
jgi:hypothetical protein